MPNRLRSNVSGKEILKFFESYGFEIDKRTRGSHLVLHRKLSFGGSDISDTITQNCFKRDT